MGITVDVSDLRAWSERMNAAASGALKAEIAKWWDAEAIEFLNLVQDEIESRGVVDTRRLLSSFSKGAAENVFETSDGGLVIQVGTNVYYAKWVEEGHRTRGGRGWVTGRFYFEAATRTFKETVNAEAPAQVAELIAKYFGG